MHMIESKIDGERGSFGEIREVLAPEGFTLANWEYHSGFFDRQLDDRAMVFLRIPIEVQTGELDNDSAIVRFKTPFVLKHVYQTDVEEEIGNYTNLSPLMNQFQEPVDKDAHVSGEWVEKAKEVLRRIEDKFV